MEIELSKEDIIAEICKNHKNDVSMFVDIIDGSTDKYEAISGTVWKLINILKSADAISRDELIDFYENDNPHQ